MDRPRHPARLPATASRRGPRAAAGGHLLPDRLTGALSALVDRAVNRTAFPGQLTASSEARALVARARPIDLLVGSALFRDSFVGGGRGHVDLPRARDAGYALVGLTVATSWPDVAGSLSRWHFRSLGLPARSMRSRMAIASWIIDRIERWETASSGRLLIVRSVADLERCLADAGPLGVLLGVQGGHVLEGDVRNVERLYERGVRMFAPAHVMDNDLVGSGTGRLGHGLTSFGRAAVAELEAHRIVIDLAHMSEAGLDETLPLLSRRFVMSHAALRESAARPGRFRRYNSSTRNVPTEVAREIGARGGLFGVAMATQLIGGATLGHGAQMVRRALSAAGEQNVCLGSDMDGALRMLIDCQGLPALVDRLWSLGLATSAIEPFIGGNAARFLRSALPDAQASRRQT